MALRNVERIDITIPLGLKKRAHDCGLNVSKVCAVALEALVKDIENGALLYTPAMVRGEP